MQNVFGEAVVFASCGKWCATNKRKHTILPEKQWQLFFGGLVDQIYSFNHSIIFHICSRFLEGLGGLSTCYHSQNIYIYMIYFFKYIYIHTSGTFTGTPRNLGLKASQLQVSATVSDVPTH